MFDWGPTFMILTYSNDLPLKVKPLTNILCFLNWHDHIQKKLRLRKLFLPFSTSAVLSAAPYPVEIPHPNKQTLSKAASLFTLAIDISAHTVYSLNVLVPIKWKISLPLQRNRVVPSGIRPFPTEQRELIFMHKMSWSHIETLRIIPDHGRIQGPVLGLWSLVKIREKRKKQCYKRKIIV